MADLIQVHQYVTLSPFYSLLFIFLIYLFFFSFFLLPSLIPPLKVLSVSPPAFIPVYCSRSASLRYYWEPNSFLWLPQLYCWYSFFLILPLPLSSLPFPSPPLSSPLTFVNLVMLQTGPEYYNWATSDTHIVGMAPYYWSSSGGEQYFEIGARYF